METIRATEARANIAALLRRVSENGESFIIERRGKPRAMLVPIDDQERPDLPADSAAGRESEALLSQAAQMANLGHWVWDEVQDKCVYCSETLARINGVTVEEYLARYGTLEDLLEDMHPEDRARYEETITGARLKKCAYDVEFRDIQPDGSPRYLRERGEPVLDDEGRLVRSVGTLQDVTEHKRAEVALHESEQRFKDFADAASDWFWEMDENCRFSYFSDRYTELSGVPQETLLGKTREETGIPNVDPEAWQAHLSDLAAHRSFRDFRHPRTHPDGRELLLSVNGKAVFDDTGVFRGYRGTASDITERRQAEKALQKTDALFKETERLARLGHWEWDEVEGKATYCSDELARLHGITVTQYLELASSLERDMESVHPEDRERYRGSTKDFRKHGTRFEMEYRLLQPGGGFLEVLEASEPVFDAQGSLVRSIGFVQDISDRKHAERAARASEADLAKAQRLAKIGSWRWSVERNELISGSEEFARIHGVGRDQIADLMANQAERTVHPEDRESFAEAFRQCCGDGADFEIEYRIVRPDGSVRHVKEIGEAIRDESGRAVEQVGTVQDITVFKRIEEELRQARDELEQRVAERTAALQESSAQLQSILDHSPAMIFLKDRKGRYLMTNREFEQVFGTTNEAIKGKRPEEILPPDLAESSSAQDLEVRDTGRPSTKEETFEVDGQERTVLTSKFPVLDDGQQLIGIGTVATDITERKLAEEALRKSEARLAKTLQQAKLTYWNYRFTAREIEGWSEEAANILGVAAKDLPRSFEAYLELVHPEDRARVAVVYRVADPAKPEHESYQIEYRITRPDGAIAWLQESAEVEHDEDGMPIGYLGTIQDITEIKALGEELARNEARLRQAVELAGLGHWVWDAVEDRCLYCSEENARIHGRSVADYMAQASIITGPISMVHPDDRERAKAAFQALRNGERMDLEYKLISPAGETRYVRELAAPVFDSNGTVVQEHGSIQDITVQKQSEEALRASEAQLRQAQQMARIGVFEWDDIEDRCLYCSEELAALLGISVEEFMATRGSHESILQWVNPGDRESYDSVVSDALRKNAPYDVEYRVLDGSGNEQYWREIGEPVLDAQGRQIRTFGTVQDISALKRTEAALRASEERYRELFDESPAAIWVEDWSPIKQMIDDLAQSGINDWRGYFNDHRDQLKTAYDLAKNIEISHAAIELYRKKDEAHMLQKSTAAVVIDEELNAFCEILLSFQAGQMANEIEAKDTAGDGSEIMVRRRVVVPPKYRDDWSRVIYAIEDVTERTRVEEQLRQAQKLEAVGQLTGGVAHDFNNLLAVIMGNAELLATGLADDDRRVQAVIRAASRGAELTERLLAFSRQQPLRPQAFDPDAAVSGMEDLLERTLGETIEMKIAATDGLWTAEADPGQLENALLNLAINARDAMPGGGKLVIETANVQLDDSYVETHPEATTGDYVMLAVTDSGTGMTPEVLEHVFEPFFTTKEVGQGSGLGLSMVYGFIKQSGGHLAIYSEPGQGTTVKLYLPRTKVAAERTGAETAAAVPQGRGEAILVVEDDPDVRQLAVTLLEDLGYEALEAPDGATALAILERSPQPDLLLSDVVLPGGLSGPEMATKAGQLFPGLKVLFMSGYAESAAHHNELTGGHSELLNKPFHRRELASKVRRVIDR